MDVDVGAHGRASLREKILAKTGAKRAFFNQNSGYLTSYIITRIPFRKAAGIHNRKNEQHTWHHLATPQPPNRFFQPPAQSQY